MERLARAGLEEQRTGRDGLRGSGRRESGGGYGRVLFCIVCVTDELGRTGEAMKGMWESGWFGMVSGWA